MIVHLNKKNKPKIVDISKKKITTRIAIAESTIQFSKSTFSDKFPPPPPLGFFYIKHILKF